MPPSSPVQPAVQEDRGRRLARLGLAAGAAAIAVFLLWWFGPREVRVPMCGFHAATGLHCPGCGAVRATHELLHGRWESAWSYNALWVLVSPLALYWAASSGRSAACGRRLPLDLLAKRWFFGLVVAAAVVFGVLRNLPWAPFCHLAPP